MNQTKILLDENEIPTHWYNVMADMPSPPAPPLGPDGKPVSPEMLARSSACGAPRPCTGPTVWRPRWVPRPGSTTRTRA
jgi:tryptophan synthase beta chain